MPITVCELADAAVPVFEISRRDIIGPSRLQHIFRARAAICLAASVAGRSYAEIGRALGGRDKNAIRNACTRAVEWCARDPEYLDAFYQLLLCAAEWNRNHAQEPLRPRRARQPKRMEFAALTFAAPKAA